MIRTGEQYRDSIRDGRQVWINGERVKDVTVHLMFSPLVDVRARIYDMQHDPRFAEALSYCSEAGESCAVALKLPRTRADWCAKRTAVETVLNEIGGVVTRVGDETVMVEGESGLLAIGSPQQRPQYEPTKRRLTWPKRGHCDNLQRRRAGAPAGAATTMQRGAPGLVFER